MARFAVVREKDGFVDNIIEMESNSNWACPIGYKLVKDDQVKASREDTWNGSEFIRPPKKD